MKNYKHDEIARLLERFMAGESTLDEEQRLARYFATHKVSNDWLPYQRMFAYFDAGMHDPAPHAGSTTAAMRRWMVWCCAAASVALLLTIGWHTVNNTRSATSVIDNTLTTAVTVTPLAPPVDTPAVEPQQQHIASASSTPRKAKRRTDATPRKQDSIEITHTQAALEVAEQEVIADRILLEQELQRARPETSGWVTTSLNIQ